MCYKYKYISSIRLLQSLISNLYYHFKIFKMNPYKSPSKNKQNPKKNQVDK